MRYLALAIAGTLIAATGVTTTAAAQGGRSLGVATHRSPHAGAVPPGALGPAPRKRHHGGSQLSPHIGLPGFSGFGRPQISPHIGLPGFSGFPTTSTFDRRRRHHHGHGSDRDFVDLGYWGYDGDGYADTIPMADQFGFFASGGEVTLDRDEPVYHYDRSYPYDWYGGPRTTGPAAARSVHCQVRRVWDSEQRKDVEVQVCGAR